MSKQKLRDQIKAAADLRRESIHVPEWDAAVAIRTLTARERSEWEMTLFDKKGNVTQRADMREQLVGRCLIDPDTDERIFDENEFAELGSKSAEVLDRLFAVARRVNGIGAEAEAAIEKNFPVGADS
jgi:hypothetical protein